MAVMEKTFKLELTETQYKHVMELLKKDKPTFNKKLTYEEKTYLKYVLKTWLNGLPEQDVPITESILNKLQ